MKTIAGNGDTVEKAGFADQAWTDVLRAMDQTYAELVDYQEQLEARNSELTNLRHFLASIMTSISDYLVVTDRDCRVAEASRSFRDAVGRNTEALSGCDIGEFFETEDCDKLKKAISTTLSLRQDTRINAELLRKAGRDPVELCISPRLDRRGKCTGVILTGRPMGELLQAYAELESSHRELKETQAQLVRNEKMASLGRLLAGVAHELNNPISFVYANTHTLEKCVNRLEAYFTKVEEGASRDELIALRKELKMDRQIKNLRSAVQGASEGAERVRDIVEDLRQLSAKGAGEAKPFDLAETARIAATWIKRGMKSDVEFTFAGEPDCIVIGKTGPMQQVLMNLLQNAVDSMAEVPDPEVRFDLSYQGDNAVMDVRDKGPGIDRELMASIFDPFFTTKDVGKGIGLGLTISHKIVEEHGGRLEVVEHQGSGSCFRITLPRGDAS